jgi:hypothetical protein
MCVFCVLGQTVNAAGNSERREILGRVKIYGSEPHTYVGIESTEDGTVYSVYPPEKELALRNLQGRVIRFKVKVLDKPQGYGSLMLTGPTVTPVSWKVLKEQ